MYSTLLCTHRKQSRNINPQNLFLGHIETDSINGLNLARTQIGTCFVLVLFFYLFAIFFGRSCGIEVLRLGVKLEL